MDPKKLKYVFPFQIIDIKTNSFSVQNLTDEETENFTAHDITFNILPSIAHNLEARVVKIGLDITYEYHDKQVLTINVDTLFECSDELKVDKLDSGTAASMLGISFSTVRGIILNRTLGNIMNNIYLPIINPAEVINEELVD